MLHYLVISLFDFIFGILALRKKERHGYFAASLFFFCASSWSLELFFLSVINDLDVLYPLYYLTRCGMFFIPFTFALYTYQVLDNSSQRFRWVVLLPGFTSCLLLGVCNVTILPSTLVESKGGYLPLADVTSLWNLVNLSVLKIICIGYSLFCYPKASFLKKQRIIWAITMLISLFVVGVLAIFLSTKNEYISTLTGAAINIGFVIMLYYTLASSHLMSLKRVFVEGATRLFVLALFVYLYFRVILVIGQPEFSIGNILIIFLFFLVMTQLYSVLVEKLLLIVKEILDKGSYDHDKTKSFTENRLSRCMSIDDLANTISDFIDNDLCLNGCRILVVDNVSNKHIINLASETSLINMCQEDSPLVIYASQKPCLTLRDETTREIDEILVDMNAHALYPIIYEGKVIGVFVAGPSSRYKQYRYEDMVLLSWLGDELGELLQRISSLHTMQNELNESRKTLSMVSMMNQYNHDIKAPFSIIDGVVSTGLYDTEKQRMIIMEQVERGARLITTMASVLRGKRNRNLTPVSLDEILLDCLLVFEKRFNKTTTKLSSPAAIIADPADLKIMFINVIKNAAESYRQNEELNLSISMQHDESTITVSIADTGIGMTGNQLKHLWDMSASSKKGGSGIGLQAIKRIADEHNVKISVDSVLGEGTTFYFYFEYNNTTPMHPNKIDNPDF